MGRQQALAHLTCSRGRPRPLRSWRPRPRPGARFGPTCFHATAVSRSLCDLRLLIGQMVDKHFFLKKISTVTVVSGEPEEVRPSKVIFSDISTHKNQSLGGLCEFISQQKKY